MSLDIEGLMDTLYWHDYETWGINPAEDMPSQFAGVRTDNDFNIVGEPLNILCRPALDVIPHAEACLVTGMTPQQVDQQGVSERDFFAAIHAELAQPNTCSVGYNSLRFDDEVTRYGLYRNFYDPYGREWQNGNTRWDIIDMLRLCYAVRPEGINWPQRDDGVVSFRLEQLTEANGLSHEAAHDALSDVYATIAVAKLIKDTHPQLFDHVFSLRQKQKAQEALALGSGKPVLHISSRFGSEFCCGSLVLPIAQHPKNKNEIICVDLRYSPKPLFDLDAQQIADLLFTRVADLPAGIDRIPLKSIHINRCPIVLTPKLVDDKVAARLSLDWPSCEAHRKQLLAFSGLAKKLQAVVTANAFDNSDRDAEALLYDGFIPNRDKPLMQKIPTADAATLAGSVFPFEDARLPDLLFRYRARNFPDSLTADEREEWLHFCRDKCLSSESGSLDEMSRLDKELENIDSLLISKPESSDVLNGLADFLKQKKKLLAGS